MSAQRPGAQSWTRSLIELWGSPILTGSPSWPRSRRALWCRWRHRSEREGFCRSIRHGPSLNIGGIGSTGALLCRNFRTPLRRRRMPTGLPKRWKQFASSMTTRRRRRRRIAAPSHLHNPAFRSRTIRLRMGGFRGFRRSCACRSRRSSSPTGPKSPSASSARRTNSASRTVAVFAEEDKLALHRFKADEAYQIGKRPTARRSARSRPICHPRDHPRRARVAAPTPSIRATASSPRIPEFAEACAAAGITFIGPSPDTMRHARRQGLGAQPRGLGRRAGHAGDRSAARRHRGGEGDRRARSAIR